jgi:hypothetical protein
MLTDEDVIADLSRLRERSAGIEYTGKVPLTRRSVAATVVPVAAVAAVATLGAAAVVGTGHDGPRSGAGSSAAPGGVGSAGTAVPTRPAGVVTTAPAIKLVSAKITLGGKTISYQHAVGEDPFGEGWSLLYDVASIPSGATEFTLPSGDPVWVADSTDPSLGASMLISATSPETHGPHEPFQGAPSRFSRAALEEFVTDQLHGQ